MVEKQVAIVVEVLDLLELHMQYYARIWDICRYVKWNKKIIMHVKKT